MNTETNNAHLALHGLIAGLVMCVAVAGFFHFAPVRELPASTIAVQPAPAECLPGGSGAPCIPFDRIQEMMNAQPDEPEHVPANPATKNLERI